MLQTNKQTDPKILPILTNIVGVGNNCLILSTKYTSC